MIKRVNLKIYERLSFPIIIYFLGLSLIGLCLMPLLPVKLTPTKTLQHLTVSFSMQESPLAIESKVTSQIESMLCRINGVSNIESFSAKGHGSITVSVDKNTDMDVVRFEVSTAIRQLWPQLPEGVSYPVINVGYSSSSAAYPFISYTLNATASSNLIREYADKQIRPLLAQIKGVSDVRVSDVQPMEWLLEYDYLKLNQLGVSVSEIQQTVSTYLGSQFMGFCDVQNNFNANMYCVVYIKPDSLALNRFDATRIPVKKIDNGIVYLNELVKCTYQEQSPQAYYRINGFNAISLSVYSEKQANQIQLSSQIRKILKEVEQKLPSGYEINLVRDSSEYVKKELETVVLRSGLAVLILLLFVFFLRRNWYYTAIIALALVSNITIAFIFYYLLDVEIQLFSIAGITISLGLVIDNVIVMSDHLLNHKKIGVSLAILAATLTTIASLSVIFLLDENLRLNLEDFAWVLIINLTVSLFISLFFIPAMLERAGYIDIRKSNTISLRRIVKLNKVYASILYFLCRWKKMSFLLLILAFGLPLFNLPPSLPSGTVIGDTYNLVFPYVNKIFGGSMRLFFDRSTSKSMQTERGETILNIHAFLPNGSTLHEMNETVKRMEFYVSSYDYVKQFETAINSSQNASITVTFTDEVAKTNKPHQMKEELISKAIDTGNATWSISGIGDGFLNKMESGPKLFCIEFLGYNYDELIAYAQKLKDVLLSYKRVKNPMIIPRRKFNSGLYEEFVFDSHPDRLMLNGLHVTDLYSAITPILMNNVQVGNIIGSNGLTESIKLQSKQSSSYNLWDLNHYMYNSNKYTFKLGQVADIVKQQIPPEINKINQQYRIYLEYSYLGAYQQGAEIFDGLLKQFSVHLPMGYTIKNANARTYFFWSNIALKKEYKALLLIIFIIYIICSILNNSLKQPLAVVLIIPISFIGVFLAFSVFDIPLNQGGFAAFVLLSGLTCNAAIYLLHDYNTLRRKGYAKGVETYIRALNRKITPILMTFLSTALGFLPFMFIQENDDFWMSLAIGVISGLLFSIVGLLIYLPILVNGRNARSKKKSL